MMFQIVKAKPGGGGQNPNGQHRQNYKAIRATLKSVSTVLHFF